MKLRGLFARQNRFYGASQQVRRQRRLRLDGQLFLRAKRSAAGCQRDLHFFRRDIQCARDLAFIES